MALFRPTQSSGICSCVSMHRLGVLQRSVAFMASAPAVLLTCEGLPSQLILPCQPHGTKCHTHICPAGFIHASPHTPYLQHPATHVYRGTLPDLSLLTLPKCCKSWRCMSSRRPCMCCWVLSSSCETMPAATPSAAASSTFSVPALRPDSCRVRNRQALGLGCVSRGGGGRVWAKCQQAAEWSQQEQAFSQHVLSACPAP